MISGTMLTEALEEVKKITSLDVVVADDKGAVKAETMSPPERAESMLATFALSDKMCYEEKDLYLLREKYEGADIDFIVMLWGEAQGRSLTADLVALQVKQFLKGNESRTPVNDLLSNLLLDNILHTNIESEASYLGIDPSEVRRVFIARAAEGRESAVLAKARNAFAAIENIHVVSVERGKTAVIVEGLAPDKARKKAEAIFETLGGEENGVLMVSYGLPVNDLEKLINSYRQAVTALETAELFDPDVKTVSYECLGVGRIINTLTEDICEAFISENFDPGEMDRIDKEILYTVEVFFDNSLNISETARKMFIHRNTLIYRLNKLYNQIGLDVRNFEDAMTFKLSSMVNKKYKALQGKK